MKSIIVIESAARRLICRRFSWVKTEMGMSMSGCYVRYKILAKISRWKIDRQSNISCMNSFKSVRTRRSLARSKMGRG